jgi:hypothetical protein
MTPSEVTKTVLEGLTLDLHAVTVEGEPGIEGVLSWNGQAFCRARCVLPEASPVGVEVPAPCPLPHSHADAVRAALLGVVAELRRASRIVASNGEHYRAEAFEDAANYIEDGRWGAKP